MAFPKLASNGFVADPLHGIRFPQILGIHLYQGRCNAFVAYPLPGRPQNRLQRSEIRFFNLVQGPTSPAFHPLRQGPHTNVAEGRVLFWTGRVRLHHFQLLKLVPHKPKIQTSGSSNCLLQDMESHGVWENCISCCLPHYILLIGISSCDNKTNRDDSCDSSLWLQQVGNISASSSPGVVTDLTEQDPAGKTPTSIALTRGLLVVLLQICSSSMPCLMKGHLQFLQPMNSKNA